MLFNEMKQRSQPNIDYNEEPQHWASLEPMQGNNYKRHRPEKI